jgi:hypothetical protein
LPALLADKEKQNGSVFHRFLAFSVIAKIIQTIICRDYYNNPRCCIKIQQNTNKSEKNAIH